MADTKEVLIEVGVTPPPSEFPWLLVGTAGALGVTTVAIAKARGKKKKR